MADGRWRRAESFGSPRLSREAFVYGIELEGHVDTVLVGEGEGVVCAGIGVYCGPDFGWNVFTRKTARCDLAACAACDICVDVTRDMAAVTTADLAAEYAPYDAARPALASLPVGPEVHGGERPGEGARGR